MSIIPVRRSLGLILLAALTACSRQHHADAELRAIYTTEWTWRETQFPDDENELKPIADYLPKADAAAQEGRLRYWEEVLHKLDGITLDDLSPAERLNYEVYRPQIEVLIANQRFRDFEMPANSDTTFWTDLGYTARRPFRTLQDYRNWLAQMKQVPRYFHEQMDEMRAGMKRGFTPPRVTMEGRDASLTAVTDATPEGSLFYTPFLDMPAVPAAQQARAARAGGGDHTGCGAACVCGTAQVHAHRVRAGTTPASRLRICRTARISTWPRSANSPRSTWNPTPFTPWGWPRWRGCARRWRWPCTRPASRAICRPSWRRCARTPSSMPKPPEELLMRAAWIAKKFDGKASQFFGYLPRARFAIQPVPPDLAPFYTAGRGGAGVYLVNTYNLPSRPLYSLTALTLHESAPGHAFQMPIAMEHADQPEFRQRSYISAYGEGWALYCEKLGLEMGMYETPYDRFGMLGYQIWRAARLVVDTGIHSQGWTRDQAIAYFRENTALADHEIETEVDRYIAWPAQALSYYLGERTILEARADAEKALGEKFNIRAFHDTVLELGSVPMPALKARINRFIAEGGKGPYPEME
jgi:uncharacterized protein (DUF885 family)